ncbi:hypothetical protein [Clostridium sp. CF012]|uniref:GAP1-N2 domain-containing protein n=1 Tax=Clostridium sp. CF012 TaxID=2843319 RepID=UPI001C0DBD99|nr:hypothetical protein [Clostridium sp. CF012]MBU3144308.1 hypothetical protein [Clostridium sp. CF012]
MKEGISMIQQHYYTRDKKGLYSDTPGYDTIAKSKGLEDKLIKGVLHDYCFYEAPFELIQEENLNRYPKALMCINIPSREMVIGCSSFVGKDYTGERNRYFTHNYVVSEVQKEFYIRNPERIFQAAFKMPVFICDLLLTDEHGLSKTFLDEIIDIPIYKQSHEFFAKDQFFKELNIQKGTYKKILSACFDSVLNNRKIYILLKVPAQQLSKYSKQLMEYIYIGLPYVVRRKFGFITYVKDSKSKEYINLQFVGKDGIRKADVEKSFAYVFDFQEGRHLNVMKLENENAYLDFVWDNLENLQVLNGFFSKSDKYIKENQLGQVVSLKEYNQIFTANFENILEYELNKSEENNIVQIENNIPQKFEVWNLGAKEKEIDRNILKDIDLAEISKRQIKSFIMEEKYKNNDTYMMVYYLQRILASSVDRETSLSERKICEISLKIITEGYEVPPILLKVKERIQYFYEKEITRETFRKIMVGFIECNFHNTLDYIPEKKDAFSEDFYINYNFQQLFDYLFNHGGIEKVRDYIVWVVNDFSKLQEKEVCFSFFEALKSYINKYDNNFFKDKNFRRQLLQCDSEVIIDRIRGLELDMCGGLKKIILGLKK